MRCSTESKDPVMCCSTESKDPDCAALLNQKTQTMLLYWIKTPRLRCSTESKDPVMHCITESKDPDCAPLLNQKTQTALLYWIKRPRLRCSTESKDPVMCCFTESKDPDCAALLNQKTQNTLLYWIKNSLVGSDLKNTPFLAVTRIPEIARTVCWTSVTASPSPLRWWRSCVTTCSQGPFSEVRVKSSALKLITIWIYQSLVPGTGWCDFFVIV
jgi:hypothetical protein